MVDVGKMSIEVKQRASVAPDTMIVCPFGKVGCKTNQSAVGDGTGLTQVSFGAGRMRAKLL
eukprot:scaffold224891_cov36-Tisochrysis_lutea.AAC.5